MNDAQIFQLVLYKHCSRRYFILFYTYIHSSHISLHEYEEPLNVSQYQVSCYHVSCACDAYDINRTDKKMTVNYTDSIYDSEDILVFTKLSCSCIHTRSRGSLRRHCRQMRLESNARELSRNQRPE